MTEAIYDRVREIVATQLKIDLSEVTETANFHVDLGADSYDNAELVIAFEDEFNVKINNRDAANMRNVKDVVEFIASKTSE